MEEVTLADFLALLHSGPAIFPPQNYTVVRTAETCLHVGEAVSFRGQTFARPIHLEHIVFEHPVDFADVIVEGGLRLEHCVFNAGLTMRDLRVKGALALRHTELCRPPSRWFDFRRMRIDGLTDFSCVTAGAGIDLANSILGDDWHLHGFCGAAAIDAENDVPKETLADVHEYLCEEFLQKALNAKGAAIRKYVCVYAFGNRCFRIDGKFDLRATIGNDVEFVSGMLINRGARRTALTMSGATIGGSVFFRNMSKVDGKIELQAHVGKDVEFNRTVIEVAKSDVAVDMDGGIVGGSVSFLNDTDLYDTDLINTQVTGQIKLQAKVGGHVKLSCTTIDAGTGTAFDMKSAHVSGSVVFRDDTRVTGCINLQAKVGGNVEFNNATLNAGKNGTAVNMEAATVSEAVFFRNNTNVTGKIDLRAAVGGNVEILNATLNAGVSGMAITMNRATVGGGVFLRNGTRIVGNVALFKATLRVGLWATDRTMEKDFEQPIAEEGSKALLVVGNINLSYAMVRGPMLFHGASIWGKIDADHLHILGDLDWCGSVAGPGSLSVEQQEELLSTPLTWTAKEINRSEPQGYGKNLGLEMKMAKVEGHLWFKGTRMLGDIDLEDTQVTGEVNFENALIAGNIGMRSTKIEGTVFGEQGEAPYPRVRGHVDLSYARLGQLDMQFADGQAEAMPSYVNLTGADVGVFQLCGIISKAERHSGSRGLIVTEGLKFQHVKLDEGLLPTTNTSPTWRDVFRLLLWLFLMGCGTYFVCNRGNGFLGLALLAYSTVCVYARFGKLAVAQFALWAALVIGLHFGNGILMAHLLYFYASLPSVWASIPARLALWNSRLKPSSSCLDCFLHVGLRCLYLPRGYAQVLNLLAWSYPFSRSFYLAVENWLRNAGDDARADEAFLMRRKRETDRPSTAPQVLLDAVENDPALQEDWQTPTLGMRLLNGFFDFALGFGVRWSRLVHVYLLLFIVNTGMFLAPRSVERPIAYMQPRFDVLGKDSTAKKNTENEPENPWPSDGGVPGVNEWGFANAAFMALRVQVPVLTLGAENDWEPASRPISSHSTVTYEEYASFMVVVNFILIPLFLAGITRQMRK